MKPRILYRVVKDILKIRIKIHTQEPGVYDTGIFCPKEKFDSEKQICGLPGVQNYMDSTSEAIKKIFIPGMTPEMLWEEFVRQRTASLQNHTVKDAFDYYMRTKKVKESTLEDKRTLLSQLKTKGYADKPIRDMSGAIIREFIHKLKLSPSSEHQAYVRLCGVLGHYIDENSLNIDLPKGLFKPSPPKESEEDEFLNWTELQTLIEAPLEDPEDAFPRDFFCLLALSGMGLADGMIFKPKTHISEDGRWLKYKRKKTGSECMLPLLPHATKIIARYKWPVKFSRRWFQYKCENLISDLVGRKMKSHSGRKTFGAISLELGYSMEAVAKFLGHSNPMITAKLYAQVSQAKIEREMKDLPPAIKEMMGV